MTTGRNAAGALRKIHSFGGNKPIDLEYRRCIALDDLNAELTEYANNVDSMLGHAYNQWCRLQGWYPIPFEKELLGQYQAEALQTERDKNLAAIRRMRGFRELQDTALRVGVRFEVSMRPSGVSVICDFLASTGDVELLAA